MSDVRCGLCSQIDNICAVVIPSFNSLAVARQEFSEKEIVDLTVAALPSIAGTGSRLRFACRQRSKARKLQLRIDLVASFC